MCLRVIVEAPHGSEDVEGVWQTEIVRQHRVRLPHKTNDPILIRFEELSVAQPSRAMLLELKRAIKGYRICTEFIAGADVLFECD